MDSKQLKRARATMTKKQERLRAQREADRAVASSAILHTNDDIEREALIEMGIDPMLEDVGCK